MDHDPFGTTGDEREDRIKKRRERIELRNTAKNEEGNSNKKDAPIKEELSLGNQQVAASLVNLDRRKVRSIENVTSIRVEADHHENVRRIEEEEKRQERLQNLQEEAINSGKQNAAIEMRWAELMEHNMPQELNKAMQEQLQDCTDINSSKDKLIKRFRDELKIKDEQYVKALKKQKDDIDELLKRMKSQYKDLQEQYEVELEAIELAFLEERKNTLQKNKNELDSLFERRRAMEIHYMEIKQEREEKYRQELNELRTKDAEDYNQLKIKLETDIQTLEQQLEDMRATYQLNTEKLEYNYRVLTERDMENSATLGQQKRKLTRLKDTLSSLMSKYHQSDAKYKHDNMELTEEYRRITKQYKDLQAKFKHFEVNDNKKYKQVWRMHEEETFNIINHLLEADKTIHEQQLGLQWKAPHESVLKCHIKGLSKEDNISHLVLREGCASGYEGNTLNKKGFQDVRNVSEEKEKHDHEEHINIAAPKDSRSKVSNAKIKLMLEMLSAEAGFLVDPQLQKEIDSLGSHESSILRAYSILKALAVEDETQIQILMSFFFNKVDDDEEDAFALELAKDDEERIQSLGLKINEDDVIPVIKAFVDERNKSVADGIDNSTKVAKAERNLALQEEKQNEAGKEREHREETAYWERLSTVIPDRTERIWHGLEKSLLKYNKVLSERSELIGDVSLLQAQNSELKAVIKQYLGDKVVEELIVPPTHVISVEQQPLYRN